MFPKNTSVSAVADYINKLCDSNQLDLALKCIHQVVEEIITEPLCTSQVFGSKALDELCLRIGGINFKNYLNKFYFSHSNISTSERETIVYIVTKLQKSGGHTKVVRDFISSKPAASHVILSTELDGSSDASIFNNKILEKIKIAFYPSPRKSFVDKLTWLQENIIKFSPSRVYLFNNHHDSVAAAAIQPEMKINGFFYHHGDHHFCLGVYLKHLYHIDPHPMGYHNCRNSLLIDNFYVPLTVDDLRNRDRETPFLSNRNLITCTAARSNKVEISYFVGYVDLLPHILKTTGGTHIHIGRLSPWAIFKIHAGLKKLGVSREKFVYIPYVPSVWKSLIAYEVDLYIASFPYGGGLTLIEAMGAGIPVALHNHIYSEILSGLDLAYHGAFVWSRPEELLNYCKTISVDELAEASQTGRNHFEKYHSSALLASVLENILTRPISPEDSKNIFVTHADEWAFWMTQQLSFRNLIKRKMYRYFRYIRRAWYSI